MTVDSVEVLGERLQADAPMATEKEKEADQKATGEPELGATVRAPPSVSGRMTIPCFGKGGRDHTGRCRQVFR